MSEEDTKVADLFDKDIENFGNDLDKMIEHLNIVIATHNKQVEEIERLNTDKEQLTSLVNSCQEEIRKLKTQLQQKENKEKELKEYIESFKKIYEGYYPYIDTRHLDLNKLLEILGSEK